MRLPGFKNSIHLTKIFSTRNIQLNLPKAQPKNFELVPKKFQQEKKLNYNIYIAAILFTRFKVYLRAHIKFTRQPKSTPKVVVHGGLTCYQVFFFERATISIRNSMKAGVIPTSEAHSCSVPTTGISIASLLDLSSLANRGIPSAFLMACLFLVLLLQLHKASAPQRATSACMADALARDPQSRSAT